MTQFPDMYEMEIDIMRKQSWRNKHAKCPYWAQKPCQVYTLQGHDIHGISDMFRKIRAQNLTYE